MCRVSRWADDLHWYPYFLRGQSFTGLFAFQDTTRMVWKTVLSKEEWAAGAKGAAATAGGDGSCRRGASGAGDGDGTEAGLGLPGAVDWADLLPVEVEEEAWVPAQ